MQGMFTCIQYLRFMEGEKHLLFFSGRNGGFPYEDTDSERGIAAIANDARVVIDTFHTAGLSGTVMPTQGVTLATPQQGSATTVPPPMGSVFSWNDTAQGQYLRTISAFTGGRASIFQDIGKALELVNQTTRVQYLLGYYPKNENWDGKYRKLDVKVHRPDLKLSFRRGYLARDSVQAYDREEFRAHSRITAAAGWPEDVKDVPFKVSTSRAADEAGKPSLTVSLAIDAAKVGLHHADGLYTGQLRISVYYSDSGRRPLGSVSAAVNLHVRQDRYREYLKTEIPCSLAIPSDLKSLLLAVIVYDMEGDKVGSKRIRIG
jgi:hypothetical protein